MIICYGNGQNRGRGLSVFLQSPVQRNFTFTKLIVFLCHELQLVQYRILFVQKNDLETKRWYNIYTKKFPGKGVVAGTGIVQLRNVNPFIKNVKLDR